MTNLGREVRLGTASLQATGNLVDSSRINVKKYAGRTGVAMAITDYLLFVEHNVRKALELCAEATKAVYYSKYLLYAILIIKLLKLQHEFKDWWWKARLGKCYFKLGMFICALVVPIDALKVFCRKGYIERLSGSSGRPLRINRP
jgi:tetratricopeptide repeat protein 8